MVDTSFGLLGGRNTACLPTNVTFDACTTFMRQTIVAVHHIFANWHLIAPRKFVYYSLGYTIIRGQLTFVYG